MSLLTKKATTPTATHAVVQAVETYIQNQNLLGEIAELDELLYDLIDLHKDNELALKRVVQCIYNLLENNNRWNVKFGAKVFHKLISVVIADSAQFHQQLAANVLICVQLYYRKFPRIDGKFLLQQLWSLSLSSEGQPHAAQILVQLFDDFARVFGEECVCSTELYLVLQSLLRSESRESRKSAYFIMRKLGDIMQVKDTLGARVCESLKCSDQPWLSYITIMESLEEQQSHLVLPTLSTLMPRIGANNAKEEWLNWLRILYTKLLQDNNILVLRWTLKYFLSNFNWTKLDQADLLKEFLTATNRTQLYNVESQCLSSSEVEGFISDTEIPLMLEALSTIPWHSVPFTFWFRNIKPIKDEIIPRNVLLNFCARVRTLRNTKLRELATRRIYELFENSIDKLSLGDYLIFVETLYNGSDTYYIDHERFIRKLKSCKDIGKHVAHMNKRTYDIIVCHSDPKIIITQLIPQMSKLPKSQHGWWRLFPIFVKKELCSKFYSTLYDINMDILENMKEPSEAQEYLIKQLECQTKDEKAFVREHCVDLFVMSKIQHWKQFDELHLSPLDILEHGTESTLKHLATLLKDTDTQIEITDEIIQHLKSHLKKNQSALKTACVHILRYVYKTKSRRDYDTLIDELLRNRYLLLTAYILSFTKGVSESLVVRGIYEGDITSGDARIEASYTDSIYSLRFDEIYIRNTYIQYVMRQSSEYVQQVVKELICVNNRLTERKPRYFENCQEHRIKIRIARALLLLSDKYLWLDELWEVLLAPCDQPNISYMYECLVAQLLPRFSILKNRLQQIHTLKPSQQVSLISVVHIYCIRNWDKLRVEQLQEVVTSLLPHTMGANFQVRLLAQMVLYRLAQKCEQDSIELPVISALKAGIEVTLGTMLNKFENEQIRLLLPEIIQDQRYPADAILYATNTPFDEYEKSLIIGEKHKSKLDEFRNGIMAKKNIFPTSTDLPIDISNLNVQRKMNPPSLIYTDTDISTTKNHQSDQELIVVASLIDKLPNLGGLARTCEVLGVKTLVLGSKAMADKPDFTNLSMTAEKTLNIVEVKPGVLGEYLIEKQSMGYTVVGAEQTAYSVSFVDFKFPEKCVLLLGHEKHGIPVDLIALLDFAVEIPQFGVVRSLNVHVTGSLFIWEYCKQHINK